MKKKTANEIVSFLKKNGFKWVDKRSYANSLCEVYITQNEIIIANNNGDQFFGTEIFWMIGFLTFFGFIDKNYKQ